MDKELIKELRKIFDDTTGYEWRRGISSNHTVAVHGTNKAYHIAAFHHVRDAEFCDVAHKHFGEMLDEIERLQGQLEECEAELERFYYEADI